MNAEEIFNEATWISEYWDGEHISFHVDKLKGFLKEAVNKIEETPKSCECGEPADLHLCNKCYYNPSYDNPN